MFSTPAQTQDCVFSGLFAKVKHESCLIAIFTLHLVISAFTMLQNLIVINYECLQNLIVINYECKKNEKSHIVLNGGIQYAHLRAIYLAFTIFKVSQD